MGVDEEVYDGMATNAPNMGRVQVAVPNIPRPRNGGISQGLPWCGGSRATRTSRSIPEMGLCFRHMMPALQKATQMTDKAIKFLDDEATLGGAKHFGVTMYSVSHWAKFYAHHWYTASRSYKFGLAESAECQFCRDRV